MPHKFYGHQNTARSVKILKLSERSEFFKIRIEDDFGRKTYAALDFFCYFFVAMTTAKPGDPQASIS